MSWYSTVRTVKRLRTSWNCANQSQVSHHGNISDPPPNSSWSYSAISAQLLWPTDFLCGWTIGLEFPAGQLAGSGYWREQFQTISEDVSVRNVLMHPAHWRFHDDALYKSTFYLLTYLHHSHWISLTLAFCITVLFRIVNSLLVLN